MLDGRRTGLPLRRFTLTFVLPGDTGVAPVLFLFKFLHKVLDAPAALRRASSACKSRSTHRRGLCRARARDRRAPRAEHDVLRIYLRRWAARRRRRGAGDAPLAGTFWGVGGMTFVVMGCGAAKSVSSAGGSANAGRGGRSSSSGGGSLKEGRGEGCQIPGAAP